MGRSSKQQCKVFAADGGFRVIQRVSREEAELRVRMELLQPEFDRLSGEHLGYRMTGLDEAVDQDLLSVRTTASISRAEMERNLERSHTAGMRELQRHERMKNGELPEDEIERTQAKIRVYPHVTAARGDILRVWPA